jgi:hypothetical protein
MTRLSRDSREIENSLFFVRVYLALFFLSYFALKKSNDVINDTARDACLNSLRVDVQVIFNIMFRRALFICD